MTPSTPDRQTASSMRISKPSITVSIEHSLGFRGRSLIPHLLHPISCEHQVVTRAFLTDIPHGDAHNVTKAFKTPCTSRFPKPIPVFRNSHFLPESEMIPLSPNAEILRQGALCTRITRKLRRCLSHELDRLRFTCSCGVGFRLQLFTIQRPGGMWEEMWRNLLLLLVLVLLLYIA